MSSKGTKTKSESKSHSVSSTKENSEPVVQVQAEPAVVQKDKKKSSKKEEPVQVVQAEAEPVVVQKDKKKSSKKEEPVQVVEVQAEPEPAVVQKDKKKSSRKTESVPVVEVQAEPEPAVVQKDKKKSSRKTESVPVVEVQAEPEPAVVQKDKKKSSKKVEPEVQAEQVKQKEGKIDVEQNKAFDDDEEQNNKKLRYFKLFYNNEFQGRYCGKKPKQAANKAFSSIIKDMKKNKNQDGSVGGVNINIDFSIRECTRNSVHKEYKYVGLRETLKEPVEVKINNEDGSVKKITYNFHNKIKKAPKV